MSFVIGLHGKFRSGKSTVETILKNIYKDQIFFCAFADALKQASSILTQSEVSFFYTQEGKSQIVSEWTRPGFEKMLQTLFDFVMGSNSVLYGMRREDIKMRIRIGIIENYRVVNDQVWFDGVTYGTVLQQTGMLFRNHIHEDIWVDIAMTQIKKSQHPIVVLTDVRLPNEETKVKESEGIVFRIERKEIQTDGRDPRHISETALDRVRMPTIENYDRLEELYLKINSIFGPSPNEVIEGAKRLPFRESIHNVK